MRDLHRRARGVGIINPVFNGLLVHHYDRRRYPYHRVRNDQDVEIHGGSEFPAELCHSHRGGDAGARGHIICPGALVVHYLCIRARVHLVDDR